MPNGGALPLDRPEAVFRGGRWCEWLPGTARWDRGPYELAEVRANDLIRFVRKATPHPYRSPIASEILLRAVPEPAQLVNGLRTGEIDLVPFTNLSAEHADTLRRAGLTVLPFLVSNVSYSLPQGPAEVRASPTRDRRVRLAMNYAVNKEAIAKTIYRGFAEPVGQFAIPGSVLWDPELPPFPYDPARAKQLLAEAGYPNGMKLPYGIDYSPLSLQDTVLAVQGDLRAVGIEVELHNNENAVIQDKIFGRNNQLLGDIYAGGTGEPKWLCGNRPHDQRLWPAGGCASEHRVVLQPGVGPAL
ncbi:MAG: hypothetical protein KatS3mg061_1617 [Dehalococcoidia bacterium]|nr:MAG: hypothetical protein KatS3mg061_1617 [Dehalococcoidia bacterium]